VLGEHLGEIPLHVVEPVSDGGDEKLGSSSIRAAIDRGDVEHAAEILGRWHAVNGPVVTGAKRGREIGFPTANIAVGDGYVPPLGIYATVLAVWDRASPDYGAVWPSVSSVGRNPTFGDDAPVTVETYVLDRDLGERLYGVEVELSFVARLRDEMKFDSVDALVAKIRVDCEAARRKLGPKARARALTPPSRS
jgi:riboflavin kinase/FMN adenylyltransferase